MSNYRNLDEITTVLKKRIATNKAFLEAWQAVTFPTKKDGTPFKTMSKNIEGAKYKIENYSMQPGEYKLYVYTHTPETGYINDYIQCYGFVEDIKSPEKLAKKENYQPQQTYLRQIYTYDLDDIKEAVAKHMVYLTEQIIDDEKQLKKLPEVFNSFNAAFKKIMQTLDEQTSEFNNNNKRFNSSFIYNAVKDCVTGRYPYV